MAAADTPAARRPSGPRLVTDTRVIARRNLRRMVRTPRLLIFTCIQPVVFVVLFRYVFGGAIHTPGMKYIDYLMPGIFAEVILFGATTAVAISTDLAGGMVDRFRSLPVSRSAFLAGRSIADLARSILAILIVLVVGTLLGFRFHNRFLPSLAGILLMIVFGYSFSWLLAFLGLIVKDPETAQIASLLPLFPFIFASTGFWVRPDSDDARLASGLRPQPARLPHHQQRPRAHPRRASRLLALAGGRLARRLGGGFLAARCHPIPQGVNRGRPARAGGAARAAATISGRCSRHTRRGTGADPLQDYRPC